MRTRSNSVTLMTEGSVKKLILAYAAPILIGSLFQQLYNTADALIVGNFVGQNALAAVTSVGSITFLLIGFFNGFATGSGVIIAREIGAQNDETTQSAVHTTVALGIVLSVLMTALGVAFSPMMLEWMGTPEEVYPLANTYLRIYFLGSTPLVMYNMCVGILRAGGDAKHPLYYLIISSLLNVFLDIFLITAFDMGVAGAAIATVFSEFVSMVLCILQLMKEHGPLHLSWKKVRFDKDNFKEIVEYGMPTALQGCVIDIANILIQSYINSFGASAVAGLGAYSRVEGFVFLPVTAFSMALTTFVSQNLGAGKDSRVKEGILFGLTFSTVLIEIIGVLIFFFAPICISAFNRDPEVIAYGAERARICSLFFFLMGFSHITSAVLRGLGKPMMPMVVMLVCWCAVRVVTLMTIGQVIHDIRLANWLYPITWGLSAGVYLIWLRNLHLFDKDAKIL